MVEPEVVAADSEILEPAGTPDALVQDLQNDPSNLLWLHLEQHLRVRNKRRNWHQSPLERRSSARAASSMIAAAVFGAMSPNFRRAALSLMTP